MRGAIGAVDVSKAEALAEMLLRDIAYDMRPGAGTLVALIEYLEEIGGREREIEQMKRLLGTYPMPPGVDPLAAL